VQKGKISGGLSRPRTARLSAFRVVRVYFFFISVIFSFAEPEWRRMFSPLDRQHLGFGDSVEQEKVT
jgi:hypothetical protein